MTQLDRQVNIHRCTFRRLDSNEYYRRSNSNLTELFFLKNYINQSKSNNNRENRKLKVKYHKLSFLEIS